MQHEKRPEACPWGAICVGTGKLRLPKPPHCSRIALLDLVSAEVLAAARQFPAVLQLLPFSLRECPRVSLVRGGYPEALGTAREAARWFRSYVQTTVTRGTHP